LRISQQWEEITFLPWRLFGCPAKTSLIYHVSLIECANTDAPQATSPMFEARFVEYRRDAGTDTFVSWKIGPLGSSVEDSTLEKIPNTITLPDGIRCLPADPESLLVCCRCR